MAGSQRREREKLERAQFVPAMPGWYLVTHGSFDDLDDDALKIATAKNTHISMEPIVAWEVTHTSVSYTGGQNEPEMANWLIANAVTCARSIRTEENDCVILSPDGKVFAPELDYWSSMNDWFEDIRLKEVVRRQEAKENSSPPS